MRIYEGQNPFQAQVGGGGFNPVNEPDVARAMERELRAGESRDRLYYQSLENNDQTMVRDAQAFARKSNADIENNLKALGKFSNLIGGLADGLEKQRQERIAVDQTMGFLTQGSQYLNAPNQQRLQQAEEVDEEVARTGPQVAQIAQDLDEQGNEVVAQSVRTNANAGAIIVGTDRIKSLAAISQYPGFINGWLASGQLITVDGQQIPVSQAARSGDARLVDAAMTAGMAQFIRTRGLTGMNLASVNRMANSLIQTNASVGGSLIRAGIKDQQTNARDVVESSAYNLANAGQVAPQEAWNTISEQMFVQPTGYTRTEANRQSVKALISGYVASGNVTALEELRDVRQVPGQKGTELSNTFGPEIEAGIKSAQQQRTANRTAIKTELEQGMYAQLSQVQGTTERIAIIEQTADAMEQQGLHQQARALRGKAAELSVPGTAQIGDVKALDQIESGEITSIQQLNELKGLGQLSDEGYQDAVKALGLVAEGGKPPADIKDIVEAEQRGTRDSVYIAVGIKRDPVSGSLIPGQDPLLSPARGRNLVEGINAEQNRIANRAWNLSEGKPLAERQRAVRDALKEWRQENLYTAGGRYYIGDVFDEQSGRRPRAVDAQTRANSAFRLRQVADSSRTLTTTNYPTGSRSKDFTEQVTAGGDVGDGVRRNFNPVRFDRAFDEAETKAFLEDWKAGKVSPELERAAQQLGMSPLALINSQSIAYGLGPVQAQTNSYAGMGLPTNTIQYLQSKGITLTPQQMAGMSQDQKRVLTNAFATPRMLGRALNAPTSSTPTNSKLTPIQRQALDVLGRYESRTKGDYNAVNQVGTKGGHGVEGYSGHYNQLGGRNLTDLTVGEIMELQARRPGMSNSEWIRQGRLHAVGRYQFIRDTFAQVVRELGIQPNERFTPELQDRMGLHHLRGNGITPWVGPRTYATASERAIIEQARRS